MWSPLPVWAKGRVFTKFVWYLHHWSVPRNVCFFLGAETISYVMSVFLSVCMPQLGSYWTDFHEILYLKILRKSESLTCRKNLTRIAVTYEYLCTFMINFRSSLLRMRNISDKSCRENQNTHSVFGNPFFRKSCRLWCNVGKYGRVSQSSFDNVIRLRKDVMCLPDTQGKNTDTHS
jgi:hypothetical protein